MTSAPEPPFWRRIGPIMTAGAASPAEWTDLGAAAAVPAPSQRGETWKTAEILILHHQLAILHRQQLRRPRPARHPPEHQGPGPPAGPGKSRIGVPHGELAGLGVKVAAPTVWEIRPREWADQLAQIA